MEQVYQPVTNNDIEVAIVDETANVRGGQSEGKQRERHYPFTKLKTNSKSMFHEKTFTDDTFKILIQQSKLSKHIQGKRLKQIYKENTPLFPDNAQEVFNNFKQRLSMARPSFISEIKLLPLWHYKTLIEPLKINPDGYYEVVVWRQGRLTKQMIDDFISFNTQQNKPVHFQEFLDQPWVHIILKTWAKINQGYQKLHQCQAFSFVRTFSFPDWQLVNPNLQDVEVFISKLSKVQSKQEYFIGMTKDDKNVGEFGFLPRCSSFVITGYYQEYGDLFIKVKSYVFSKWNRLCSDQESSFPEQQPELQDNQFLMPLKQFQNIFHLIFCTYNKYIKEQNIFYTKFNLNLDARQSKAKMLTFTVQNQCNIGINAYFPPCRSYHLSDPNRSIHQVQLQSPAHQQKENSESERKKQPVIPFCKILIAKQIENANIQASFVQSMKDQILKNEDGDFLRIQSQIQYQWVKSDYFKGYDNQVTYTLKLQPGRYFVRYKIQQLKTQYRCIVNTTATEQIIMTDAKKDKNEQIQFLAQALSHKARTEHRNITFLSSTKKGSWIAFNGDFQSVGYGSIVLQAVKNSENKILVEVDPKKLKDEGYNIKGHKQQNKFTVTVENGQSSVLIIKRDTHYKKQWKWPPESIVVSTAPKKLVHEHLN